MEEESRVSGIYRHDGVFGGARASRLSRPAVSLLVALLLSGPSVVRADFPYPCGPPVASHSQRRIARRFGKWMSARLAAWAHPDVKFDAAGTTVESHGDLVEIKLLYHSGTPVVAGCDFSGRVFDSQSDADRTLRECEEERSEELAMEVRDGPRHRTTVSIQLTPTGLGALRVSDDAPTPPFAAKSLPTPESLGLTEVKGAKERNRLVQLINEHSAELDARSLLRAVVGYYWLDRPEYGPLYASVPAFRGRADCGSACARVAETTSLDGDKCLSDCRDGFLDPRCILETEPSSFYECVAAAQAHAWDPSNSQSKSSYVPVLGADSVSAGSGHTCAVGVGGHVACWGRNLFGALGNGSSVDSATPVQVTDIVGATSVSAGLNYSCALVGGHIKCWGANRAGQGGNGTLVDSPRPVEVKGVRQATAVSAGKGHACAVVERGAILCWGLNTAGELGIPDSTPLANAPVRVPGLTGAVSVSAGEFHTCSLMEDGTIKCWGRNYYGQLGDNTTTDSFAPVTAIGIMDAISVSVGPGTSCASTAGGEVLCWGSHTALGSEDKVDSPVPLTVDGLCGVRSISVGHDHACGLLVDGSVQCWGSHLAHLGLIDEVRNTGVPWESDVSGALSISAGVMATCAVVGAGALRCWGKDDYGSLGVGTRWNSDGPVPVRVRAAAVSP